MEIVTGAQMREIDRRAIEEYGIPGIVLMENAGLRVVETIRAICPQGYVVILCGSGNNGGDGFVAARHLLRERDVRVWLTAAPESYRGDARTNLDILCKLGVPLFSLREAGALARLEAELAGAELVVDALLGTGVNREVDPLLAAIIETVNRKARSVLAVDVPSGVCADTGRILGVAVRADLSVTFALPKRGLLLYPGAAYTGRLEVVDIGIPPALLSGHGMSLITLKKASLLLPGRPSNAHKGTFGSVLLVAGSPGMPGAAVLAARAALRGGCGLVYAATPRSVQTVVASQVAEAITVPLPENKRGRLQADALPVLREKWRSCHALAVGPGMTRDEEALPVLAGILRECDLPVVLDADALNLLANQPELMRERTSPTVLTPHPGEAARLLGCTPDDVQADRVGAAVELAQRFKAVAVLKGAHTVVAEPGGTVSLNLTGNSGMSTAGSGDILTGLLVSLLAQRMEPLYAAWLAVCLHGLSGDIAAEQIDESSLVAGDITDHISQAYLRLRKIHM